MTVNGHPDDECVGTGGVMARYAAEGLRVVCVVATRGEAGEIVDAELNTPENLAGLGAIREVELRRGLRRLGVTEAYFLDYRDSGMMGTPDNRDPRSFWRADSTEACGRLVRIIREVRSDVVVSPNAYGGDGHPDHVRASEITRHAFDVAGDPTAFPEQLDGTGLAPWAPSKLYEVVEQLHRGPKLRRALRAGGIRVAAPIVLRVARRWRPWHELERFRASREQTAVTTRVDVRAVMDVKYAAIEEHRTQIGPDSDRLTLTPEERRRVAPTEDFTLRASRIPTAVPEDDLFAGLR
jgi:LmbE family N-acetylglucosaminyl deacetylase